MPKITDYVTLWEKYQRECVPQKIPIERFCVMNGYNYKQFELWYKTGRNVSFTPLELSDPTVSSETPVTSSDQSFNFQIKCLRLVLSDGIEIRKRILIWIQPSRCSVNYTFDMFGLTGTLNCYLCDGFTDMRWGNNG